MEHEVGAGVDRGGRLAINAPRRQSQTEPTQCSVSPESWLRHVAVPKTDRNGNNGTQLLIQRPIAGDEPHALMVVVLAHSSNIRGATINVRHPTYPAPASGALRCTNLRKQGNELMAAGEKELAIEKYSAALREDPHNLAASNNRAQVSSRRPQCAPCLDRLT